MDTTAPVGVESLVALRRELHQQPELRFEEHRTAGLVADRLHRAGMEVRRGVAGTGVVGILPGSADRPHVLIRADMDAVPTVDTKPVHYASRVPGVAHACGHDVHTAVVLGVGEQLARRPQRAGRVTVVFQPAEEIPFGERSGGRAMIDAGILEEHPVDVVLGLHCWPELPVGVVGVDEHVAMAAKDAFRVRAVGAGSHAAMPSRGRDALLTVSQLVVALHHLASREVDPGQRLALNIGTISGGSSQSIVPAAAEITGTLRTVDPDVRARLRASIERVVAAVGDAYDVACSIEWANEMPAVLNDPRLVTRASAVLADCDGVDGVLAIAAPPMTTDDFALYAERAPGLYLKLGVCGTGKGEACRPLHDGGFDVDERAIGVGVAALTALTESLIQQPLRSSDA